MFDHPLVEGGRDDTRYYNDSGVKGLLGKYAASHSMSSAKGENPEHYINYTAKEHYHSFLLMSKEQ